MFTTLNWEGMTLKALTLRQPFASLVALGEMWIETRDWQTHYRGPLAIHAGSTFTQEEAVSATRQPEIAGVFVRHGIKRAGDLPLGAIVAIAQLVDIVPMGRIDRAWIAPTEIAEAARYVISEKDQAFADFSADRFAWILTDVQRLQVPEPVPAADEQGLWDWEGERMRS